MKQGILLILALVVVVALVAPSIPGDVLANLQVSCANGETDAGLCRVLEITGLFAVDHPTPASVADSNATH